MNKQFTKDFVRGNLDCYEKQNRIRKPVANKELDNLGEVITLKEILQTSIPTEDKFWWIIAHTDINVPELQELSMYVADVAAEIYEKEMGSNALAVLVERAKNGDNTLKEIRALNTTNNISDHAMRSALRAVTTLFTKGHKRPLTIRAIHRLMLAALHKDEYKKMVRDILKNYY